MQARHLRFLVAVAGLTVAHAVCAQSNIAELIEQTGIESGAVAMRDVPGWKTPEKIVAWNLGLTEEDFRKLVPGVEVVEANSEAEAIVAAEGADAIIGWCSEAVLSAAPAAVWVQIYSAGADRCMATGRIKDGSVVLTNMQKMSSPVIAEHVMAMTLGLARQLPQFARSMPGGEWLRSREITGSMQSLTGKTMLVVGLGGIGTEVARRAAALDMRVIGTRRSSRQGPTFVDYVGLSNELLELAAQADFTVVTLPLTEETRGSIDKEFFAAVKPGSYFINVGRGGTVVTDDLVAALEAGQIAGAGLDVTAPEPLPPDHPLWQMHNVIITPHVAGRGSNRARHVILLEENLRRFVAGDALLNVVDPELGY